MKKVSENKIDQLFQNELFDFEMEAPAGLFEQIVPEIEKKKSITPWIMRIAAALIILLFATFLLMPKQENTVEIAETQMDSINSSTDEVKKNENQVKSDNQIAVKSDPKLTVENKDNKVEETIEINKQTLHQKEKRYLLIEDKTTTPSNNTIQNTRKEEEDVKVNTQKPIIQEPFKEEVQTAFNDIKPSNTDINEQIKADANAVLATNAEPLKYQLVKKAAKFISKKTPAQIDIDTDSTQNSQDKLVYRMAIGSVSFSGSKKIQQ